MNDDALTVDTGSNRITITVDPAREGPRGEQGEPVEVGDVVRVETVLDRELFEGRVLEARAIMIVSAAAG